MKPEINLKKEAGIEQKVIDQLKRGFWNKKQSELTFKWFFFIVTFQRLAND